MKRLRPSDTLIPEAFLYLHPPSQPEGVSLPYFSPKGFEVFRCGQNLYPRYSDLKAACVRREEPDKTCLCRMQAWRGCDVANADEQKTLQLV